MALSTPRTLFGIHSIAPYNRSTGEFYGTAKVLKGSNFSLSGEVIELTGGSSKFPWQVEDGLISAELSLTMNEYPAWVFELFLGQSLTEISAEASGNVSTIANKYGTSLVDATTGLASIAATVGSESALKFGKYVAKVTAADTLTIYASSDIDFAGEVYTADSLAIGTVVIPDAGGTVDLADFGLTFTGGSGTIAMTIGHTATFEVRNVNSGAFTANFGSASATYPEFGAVVMAQMQGSGRMFELDILKLKNIGAPINFSANEFSEFEVTAKASYDSSADSVFKMREVL